MLTKEIYETYVARGPWKTFLHWMSVCTFWGIDQPCKIVQASATSALLPVFHAASCKTLFSGTETRPKDGDLAETSRWSCSPKLGGECTISYDLGEEYSFQELRLGEAEATDQLLLLPLRR